MMVLRPVAADDLDQLERLTHLTGVGMTNLPPDPIVLKAKIEQSLAAFARVMGPKDQAENENYLFVLEDTDNNKIVGSSVIFASVGLDRPFYSYRILDLPHVSPELDVYKSLPALHLVNQYHGVAEVAGLFLDPDYRIAGYGRILARARYLFMAQFRNRFPGMVIAEIRGVQYAEGHSAFWDAIGAHFFDVSFIEADKASAYSTQFIADLMPKHPIYTCMLPKAVQDIIGVAHDDSKPALRLLEKEGFRYEGCVDVFDAGPQVHCPLDHIRSVRESRCMHIAKIQEFDGGIDALINNSELEGFRLCRGQIQVHSDNEIIITPSVANALSISHGDQVRFVKFQGPS